MAGHSYESALPISSAFWRAARTSPAKRPNCLPASLTFLARLSRPPALPGTFTPRILRLRARAVRPSRTPPAIPAAAPNAAVAIGTTDVLTASPAVCAALPAVCLTVSAALPFDDDRARDVEREADDRDRDAALRPLLCVRARVFGDEDERFALLPFVPEPDRLALRVLPRCFVAAISPTSSGFQFDSGTWDFPASGLPSFGEAYYRDARCGKLETSRWIRASMSRLGYSSDSILASRTSR